MNAYGPDYAPGTGPFETGNRTCSLLMASAKSPGECNLSVGQLVNGIGKFIAGDREELQVEETAVQAPAGA